MEEKFMGDESQKRGYPDFNLQGNYPRGQNNNYGHKNNNFPSSESQKNQKALIRQKSQKNIFFDENENIGEQMDDRFPHSKFKKYICPNLLFVIYECYKDRIIK